MINASQWVIDAVQRGRDFFCLGGVDWSIKLVITDRPGYHPSNGGSTNTNGIYLQSTIELNNTLKPDLEGQAVILHELGHTAMYEIDLAVQRILEEVPEATREIMREYFEQAEERYLQRLSRGLVSALGLATEEDN